MKKQLKKIVALSLALSLSVSSSLVSFASDMLLINGDHCITSDGGYNQYEDLKPFYCMGGSMENGMGYLNKNNEVVIPSKFTKAGAFLNGCAIAYYGNSTCVIIDKQGQILKEFKGLPVGIPGRFLYPDRYPFAYNLEIKTGVRPGILFSTYDTNGARKDFFFSYGEYPFIEPENSEETTGNTNKMWIGNFKDGHANIYTHDVSTIKKQWVKREWPASDGWSYSYEKDKAVGSLNVDGTVSQAVYPDVSDEDAEQISKAFQKQLDKLYGNTGSVETSVSEGGWKQDSIGWWYQNTDGSCTKNGWQNIDGKDYYFDTNGYMLHDTTTPDGYAVGSDGAWIK